MAAVLILAAASASVVSPAVTQSMSSVDRRGIAGDPIPLNSQDADLRQYFEQVRRRITKHWAHPCVTNGALPECEHKSARVVVDFGILRDGPVAFVEVQTSSGFAIYDESALKAVTRASPFPPVPAAVMARVPQDSAGIPVRVRFSYFLESGGEKL